MRPHPPGVDGGRGGVHIDIPTRAESSACSSRAIRVRLDLPADEPGHAGRAGGPIELKNLARGGRQLEEAGADRRGHRGSRGAGRPPRRRRFWADQARSLAVFATPAGVGLPAAEPAHRMVEVSDRFHVKPLLRAVTFPQAAFVLALAAGSVRLVEIAPDGPPITVAVAGLPATRRAPRARPRSPTAPRAARLQGSEGQKVRLRQYARKVDQALRASSPGLELPLILAAAEPLASIYRSVNSYPQPRETGIPGNPDRQRRRARRRGAGGPRRRSTRPSSPRSAALSSCAVADGAGATDMAEWRGGDVRRGRHAARRHRREAFRASSTRTPARSRSRDDDAVNYGVVDEIARRVLLSGGRVLAVRAPTSPAAAGSRRSCATPPDEGGASRGRHGARGRGARGGGVRVLRRLDVRHLLHGDGIHQHGRHHRHDDRQGGPVGREHRGRGSRATAEGARGDRARPARRHRRTRRRRGPSCPRSSMTPRRCGRASSRRPACTTRRRSSRSSTTRSTPPAAHRAPRSARSTARPITASTSTRGSSTRCGRAVGVQARRTSRSAYVVAHELGHHVQVLPRRDAARPRHRPAGSCRHERALGSPRAAGRLLRGRLDAHPATGAVSSTQAASRTRCERPRWSESDFQQRQATGTVNPEDWTHGSSQQRQQWLTTGFQQGPAVRVRHVRLVRPGRPSNRARAPDLVGLARECLWDGTEALTLAMVLPAGD